MASESDPIFPTTSVDDISIQLNASNQVEIIPLLGEVRMFALSMTGSLTKANLQAKGWAICDGTTPATQGISSPTITTTPDLQDKFISMSNDESSGTTGGYANLYARWTAGNVDATGGTGWIRDLAFSQTNPTPSTTTSGNPALDNRPPFYEVAFFMKVK